MLITDSANVATQKPAETAEECRIWSTILQQVRETDSLKLPSNRTLIVLGDNDSGKSTLIAKMAGLENPKKGSGLEYNFVEIRDEYRDDSTKLGVWILDGDLGHVNLLNFALTEANFENSSVLLVASVSKPWNIMRSMQKWATVLENHINGLNLKPARLKQARQRVLLKFLNYVSPVDEAESRLVANIAKSSQDAPVDRAAFENAGADADQSVEGSPAASEIGRDTLSRNLGIDIIVVITKADHISVLERDYDYTEEHLDFIQQAIRKFCLQLGASLFYVSAQVNKNCDLLHQYLAHRIYDLPFKTAASVVEKDAIFVPAGWDNAKKISILYDNIRSADPDDDYNNFIVERSNPGPAQRDAEIEIGNDQEFLSRMQNDLGKQSVQAPAPMQQAPSPVQSSRQNVTTSMDGAPPANEGVLQNFFNSLLSKGRTMPPGSGPTEPQ